MALTTPIRAGSSQVLWNAHLQKIRSQVLCLPHFQNKRLNPPLESTDAEKRGGGHAPPLKPNVPRPEWPAFSPSSRLAPRVSHHSSLVPHHCFANSRRMNVCRLDFRKLFRMNVYVMWGGGGPPSRHSPLPRLGVLNSGLPSDARGTARNLPVGINV